VFAIKTLMHTTADKEETDKDVGTHTSEIVTKMMQRTTMNIVGPVGTLAISAGRRIGTGRATNIEIGTD